jgi:hypothetical protein
VEEIARQMNPAAMQMVIAGDRVALLPALEKLGIHPSESIEAPLIALKP